MYVEGSRADSLSPIQGGMHSDVHRAVMQADPKSSRLASVEKRCLTPYNGCDLSQGTPGRRKRPECILVERSHDIWAILKRTTRKALRGPAGVSA
jgi:hypothetical protein